MHRNTLVTVPPGLPPGHPQSYIASDPTELCTFEYTWSTAEEGTSSPAHRLCVFPPIWVLFLFSFFFVTQLAAILMKVMGGSQP